MNSDDENNNDDDGSTGIYSETQSARSKPHESTSNSLFPNHSSRISGSGSNAYQKGVVNKSVLRPSVKNVGLDNFDDAINDDDSGDDGDNGTDNSKRKQKDYTFKLSSGRPKNNATNTAIESSNNGVKKFQNVKPGLVAIPMQQFNPFM